MSSVQEIQAALTRLSRDDLQIVERWIVELKRREGTADDYAYGQQEYGVSKEELERFDERMKKHNADAVRKSETTAFPGTFDPASLD